MKARSELAVNEVVTAVASVKGPRNSKIFSEWLAKKAAYEGEPHLFSPPELSGPNYFDLNYDATLVAFSFFDPQTLCRLAAVSKATRTLAESNDYWLPWFRLHKKITIVPRALLVGSSVYWKALYENAHAKYATIKEGYTVCAEGDALLIPSQTFYEHLTLDKPNIHIMGVPDSEGGLPVIECSNDHLATISATGCTLQNLDMRQPAGENITCLRTLSGVTLTLDSCIISSAAHSCACIGSDVSKAGNVVMRNCEVRNFKNRGVLLLKGAIEVHNCKFYNGPNALLLSSNTSAVIRDSEFHHTESVSVFAMYAGGSLEISGCKFRDVGGGVWVSNGARAACTRCDFQTFKWGALEVHDGLKSGIISTGQNFVGTETR